MLWYKWWNNSHFYTGLLHILILWCLFFTYMTWSTVGKKMAGMHLLMKQMLLFTVMAHLGNTQSDGKALYCTITSYPGLAQLAFCCLQYNKTSKWWLAKWGSTKTVHTKKRSVHVTRVVVVSCMNEQLKCREMFLRNSLYSLEYYIAPRDQYLGSYRKQHL